MIKVLITCFVLCIGLFPAHAFSSGAECKSGSCNIYSAPAPALTQYLQDMQSVLARSQNTSKPTTGSQISGRLHSTYASILSFDGYFGSFDFFVIFPIFQDVPPQVMRDYEAIERINTHIKKLLKHSSHSTQVNICNGITYCNISSGSQRQVLLQLLKNNNIVLQFYRQSIMGKRPPKNLNSITLVSQDFVNQIQTHYNPVTIQECSACKESYSGRLREKIGNIVKLNAEGQKGILEWKAAIDLITGNVSKERYAVREREILETYLAESGVSTGQAERILGNLDRFNAGGLSSSNPLQNTMHYTKDKSIEKLDIVQEYVKENLNNQKSLPIADFAIQTTDIKNTSQIENEISKMYSELLPIAYVHDNDTMALQSRLFKMHTSLTETTNTFRSLKQRSERLCEKQGVGLGRCRYTSQ